MNNKKVLFCINSLGNGGAERVCLNLASQFIKDNYQVDFILLRYNKDDKVNYNIDKNINIYSLDIDTTNKFIKIIKALFIVRKFNKIIKDNTKDNNYDLITSHLPISNIITRLSIIRNDAIYVLHNKIETYSKNNNFITKMLYRFLYNKKKLVAVSNGLRYDTISKYNIDGKYIKTIYNPIDLEEIYKLSLVDDINYKPYILHVGRFGKQKRQDRMLEIFYRGKFYNKYNLVFCGVGDSIDEIKKQAELYGISDKVIFALWQENVYKYMKNAAVMVSTSDYEAFPMNLIEAMAVNTKIVAGNCEYGPSEILISNYEKYLVKYDNIEEYIDKINLALNNKIEDKCDIVNKCDVKNIIKEYLEYMKG